MTKGFRSRPFSNILIICCIALVGISGFILGRFTAPNKDNTPEHIQQFPPATREAVLFFIKSTPTNFYLKPILYKLPNSGDIHIRALEGLFNGPPSNSKLSRIFPKDTKVLGLTVQKGIAFVNLNRRATQINVGSSGEALAVASIANTLTKFPDIFRVKILIEGKEVESLAGHVDLTGLIRYNDQAVDPDFFK